MGKYFEVCAVEAQYSHRFWHIHAETESEALRKWEAGQRGKPEDKQDIISRSYSEPCVLGPAADKRVWRKGFGKGYNKFYTKEELRHKVRVFLQACGPLNTKQVGEKLDYQSNTHLKEKLQEFVKEGLLRCDVQTNGNGYTLRRIWHLACEHKHYDWRLRYGPDRDDLTWKARGTDYDSLMKELNKRLAEPNLVVIADCKKCQAVLSLDDFRKAPK